MPRITKVYTRTGDEGSTGLGTGKRVGKDSLRIVLIGDIDELNSEIGVAIATGVGEKVREYLQETQNTLFHLGADLCVPEEDKKKTAGPRVEQRHVDLLENWMDRLSAELPPLENFILPGGSLASSHLFLARAVCRRAERVAVALGRVEKIGPFVIPYINRLSDTLFVMARYENKRSGILDILWDSRT